MPFWLFLLLVSCGAILFVRCVTWGEDVVAIETNSHTAIAIALHGFCSSWKIASNIQISNTKALGMVCIVIASRGLDVLFEGHIIDRQS